MHLVFDSWQYVFMNSSGANTIYYCESQQHANNYIVSVL